AIAADDFAQDDAQRAIAERTLDTQLGERTAQPAIMQRLVQQPPAADSDHLIDTVGELIAAVFDMYRRIAMRAVAAIDIGYAGHECASPPLPPEAEKAGPQMAARKGGRSGGRWGSRRCMPTSPALRYASDTLSPQWAEREIR